MAGNSEADRYFQRMQPLGPYRCQVLVCSGSEDPRSPTFFDPPEGADLNAAFRDHLVRVWDLWVPIATGRQYNGLATVAAGLLTYGQLEMAEYVLGQLPPYPIRNGYCNLLAARITKAVLPLPPALRDCAWVEGTAQAEAVRRWFAEHRSRLVWVPSEGRFRLATAPDTMTR